jgi:integrase
MSPTPDRFTETALARLRASQRRYTVFDPSLPAFGLRVEPSGRRTFQLSYRVGGRLRMATLGRLGVVTLDQARRDARRMLGQAAAGIDPLAAKDAAKGALSVRAAATRWLAEHVAARRKPATMRLYKLAEGHISRTLGSIPVDQLTNADVTRLHGKLKATPYLGNRVVAALSSLVTWCERQGFRRPDQNPCRGIEKYTEHGHDRYLTTAEYARLGKAIRDAERTGSVHRSALAAIRLLLLTGCRPSEVLTLEWAHVDLGDGVLRLADSKTGEKTVHLPPEGVQLLKRWPKHAGSPLVFPGAKRLSTVTADATEKHPVLNLAKPWKHLRRAAGIEDVRLYDACRHSFASVAISRHGHSLSVVGELLGHSQPATTKKYAHLHDDAARVAVGQIGGTIAAALRRKVSA